ncbi:hypothetical protein HSX11_22340 [Oxalobacteraceae bacterium]|nr:hypothetical protein [Oxalobacteraceae bacterium]
MKAIIAVATIAGATALGLSTSAWGQDGLVLCIEDQAASPFTYPNKDGTMQVLIRMAAKQTGVAVSFKPTAWKKCIENVRGGGMSGLVNAGYTAYHTEYAAFPMLANGKPNTAQSLASTTLYAYRLKGGNTSWDGSKFSNLTQPVLMPAGFATISDYLKSLNVPYDDTIKEPLRNLYKLAAGQAQIALGYETEMNAQLASHKELQDKIEMIPAKFMTTDYYVPFGKAYYTANKAQVDALWDAIGKVRKSKEYQDAIKDIK